MRITSFIAAMFTLASFLSSSVDNAAMAAALAKPETAQFLTNRAINKLQLHGMQRRTLYKRAPQRGKDNNENRSKGENEDRSGNENEDRNGDENENRGEDRSGNRAGNRGDGTGSDRDDDRSGKEDDAKAKNDEDDERNAKNNDQDPNEGETSDDDAEADRNTDDGVAADDTAANDTAADNTTVNETSASGEGDTDSNLYNSGPSSVNTKGVQNGTVIAVVVAGGLLLVGASVIVFMRRKKHEVQTEAIIEKSATAFAQQNSEYETLEDDPPPVGTFQVITNFTPNLSDELEVEPGDQITVLVEYDDGWVQGINESRGGTKGVMPRHCLNMSSKYSMNKRSSSIAFTNVNLG